MKNLVLIIGLILIVGVAHAQQWTYEKYGDTQVKIKKIKILKDAVTGEDRTVIDDEYVEYRNYGDIAQDLLRLQEELANWDDPTWIAAEKAKVQDKINKLTAAKNEIEK